MSWLEDHWDDIVALPAIQSSRAKCAVGACDRLSQAMGLCVGHYNVARQRFDPEFRARYLASKTERRKAERST